MEDSVILVLIVVGYNRVFSNFDLIINARILIKWSWYIYTLRSCEEEEETRL